MMTGFYTAIVAYSRRWRPPSGRLRSAKLLPLLLAPLLLAGCHSGGSARDTRPDAVALTPSGTPPAPLASVCHTIWQTDLDEDVGQPEYWLHAMECANRMTPLQARAEAGHHQQASWHESFRQSILLNVAGISVAERRRAYQQLLDYRAQFPGAIYPLFKLWRQQQALRLILADERGRNQRQLEANAAEIAILQEQLRHQQRLLELTSRKLENLTDIERRLSSRKAAPAEFPPDGNGAPAGGDGSNPLPPVSGPAAGDKP